MFFLSDGDETADVETLKPSGVPYKEDAMTPVFSWQKKAYTAEQLVTLLVVDYNPEETCISPPINVSHNVAFLVDTKSLQHHDDYLCDDMGSWRHNGSPKRKYFVQKDSRGVKGIYPAKEHFGTANQAIGNLYELRRAYYKNRSDESIRKIVSKLYGKSISCKPVRNNGIYYKSRIRPQIQGLKIL